MNRAQRKSLASRLPAIGPATSAGVEAGLAGAILTLLLPIVLWVMDLESLLCLIPTLGNLTIWPITGILAAYWFSNKKAADDKGQLYCGILAGLVVSFCSALSVSVTAMLRTLTNPSIRYSGLIAPVTAAEMLSYFFLFFGLPMLIIGTVLTAVAFLATALHLEIPVLDAPTASDRLKDALGRPAPRSLLATPDPAGQAQSTDIEIQPRKKEAPRVLTPAISAIEHGQRKLAIGLLADILREKPNLVQAWLWMASALEERRMKRECLERALTIDPDNDTARRMLDALEKARKASSTIPAEAQPPRANQKWVRLIHKLPASIDGLYLFGAVTLEILLLCATIFLRLR
jgi:hypothetical protein